MKNDTEYLLVDSRVLPEVFTKVIKAKSLLIQGRASTSSEACKLAGLSRSAFYKYRDCVHLCDRSLSDVLTLYTMLMDEPGVLSSVLGCIRDCGGNILTINQSIPDNEVASVSISLRCGGLTTGIEELISRIRALRGVVSIRMTMQR